MAISRGKESRVMKARRRRAILVASKYSQQAAAPQRGAMFLVTVNTKTIREIRGFGLIFAEN